MATHLDSACINDEKPDPSQIDPIILTMPDNNYWRIGESIKMPGVKEDAY